MREDNLNDHGLPHFQRLVQREQRRPILRLDRHLIIAFRDRDLQEKFMMRQAIRASVLHLERIEEEVLLRVRLELGARDHAKDKAAGTQDNAMEIRRHIRVVIAGRVGGEKHIGATGGGAVLPSATEVHMDRHIDMGRTVVVHNPTIHRAHIQLEVVGQFLPTLHVLIRDQRIVRVDHIDDVILVRHVGERAMAVRHAGIRKEIILQLDLHRVVHRFTEGVEELDDDAHRIGVDGMSGINRYGIRHQRIGEQQVLGGAVRHRGLRTILAHVESIRAREREQREDQG